MLPPSSSLSSVAAEGSLDCDCRLAGSYSHTLLVDVGLFPCALLVGRDPTTHSRGPPASAASPRRAGPRELARRQRLIGEPGRGHGRAGVAATAAPRPQPPPLAHGGCLRGRPPGRRVARRPPPAASPSAPPGGDGLDELVETALFAASTGLAYTLSSAFRLEAHLGAFFPLPLVLCASRHPPRAVLRTLCASCLLLLLLGGPLRAATYFLLHGLLGACVGLCWAARVPWALGVPLAAAARTAGLLASLALSSLLLRDNVAALVVAQLHAGLDQLASLAGVASPLTPSAVVLLALSLLFLNSACYVLLLHCLYALILFGGRQQGRGEAGGEQEEGDWGGGGAPAPAPAPARLTTFGRVPAAVLRVLAGT